MGVGDCYRWKGQAVTLLLSIIWPACRRLYGNPSSSWVQRSDSTTVYSGAGTWANHSGAR
jgi:hypothetical protein